MNAAEQQDTTARGSGRLEVRRNSGAPSTDRAPSKRKRTRSQSAALTLPSLAPIRRQSSVTLSPTGSESRSAPASSMDGSPFGIPAEAPDTGPPALEPPELVVSGAAAARGAAPTGVAVAAMLGGASRATTPSSTAGAVGASLAARSPDSTSSNVSMATNTAVATTSAVGSAVG